MLSFDAVIVAGGRASRLGGVEKGDVAVRGQRLIDRALTAVAAARTRVVVGEVAVPPSVLVTRETPAFTGPANGCLAGLQVIADPAEWVVLLACDLPNPSDGVAQLLAALPVVSDGVCLLGPDGRRQWLFGAYRRSALLAAAAPGLANRSMRFWLAGLSLVELPGLGATTADIDTWDDHALWENDDHN